MKRITVYQESFIDLPENFVQFMEFMQNHMDKIPEDHQNNAIIEIESLYEGCINVKIYYTRPLTEKEIQQQQDQQVMQNNNEVIREKQQLKKLLQKYGEELK